MEQLTLLKEIAEDTLKGLTSNPKYLLPKYFYDEAGSKIFQDIMGMEEYYLTDSEYEIFSMQKMDIAKHIRADNSYFDLIELGSGDGLKSRLLISHLVKNSALFKYIPVDISEHANEELVKTLTKELPDLKIQAKTGDYFRIIKHLAKESNKRKVIMFLGANIGNFSESETNLFFRYMEDFTNPGDQLLIGFDLKKSPEIIKQAYDDPYGHTKRFNLNHLRRLNNELGADFDLDKFEQHTVYDPVSGAVKSYLVSLETQEVYIEAMELCIGFKKWEPVFMELSQKYSFEDINQLAEKTGFKVLKNFTDRKEYFVDSLWVRE
jgi:dimethylhistidine N-methyltransferase